MITVVTSICGGKDNPIDGQNKGNAQFVAYLDVGNPKDWEVRLAYDRFKSPRRNSRVPKILIHQFVDTEYSIWLDGNLKLLCTPEHLIETYLKDHDIATFKHPTRNCIYDEAIECAKRGLDDPEVIIKQASKYEREGFGKHKGQGECMMILRRHTSKVEQFNNYWWSEYTVHSVRDQISFMYALDKAGLNCNFIDEQFTTNGRYIRGGLVEIVPHLSAQQIGNG